MCQGWQTCTFRMCTLFFVTSLHCCHCLTLLGARDCPLYFSGMARVRLADLNGPKWTSSGQNGPKWTVLVHFGLANAKIQFGTRSFWPKWSFGPFWTILVQYTFRQHRGHSLNSLSAEATERRGGERRHGGEAWGEAKHLCPMICCGLLWALANLPHVCNNWLAQLHNNFWMESDGLPNVSCDPRVSLCSCF